MNIRVGLSLVGLGIGAAFASGACSSDDSGGGSGGTGTGGFGATGAVGATGGTGGTGGTGATGTGGGSNDPCAADENNAANTVACNGAAIGAQADNAYGGKCTPDANSDQGSCSDPTHICDYYTESLGGICVLECTPGASYVSTGGCPTGSRCFDFGDIALCYPDCGDDNGCGTGVCDGDGACSSPFPPETDGGDTDGGVTDASTD